MDEFEPEPIEAEEEVVDGLPVLAEVRELESVPAGGLGAVHAVAVAATGFAAPGPVRAAVGRGGDTDVHRARSGDQPRALVLPAPENTC